MTPRKRLMVALFSFLILALAAGPTSAAGGGDPPCYGCMDEATECSIEEMEPVCDLMCNGRDPKGCWDIDPGICDPDEQHVRCEGEPDN